MKIYQKQHNESWIDEKGHHIQPVVTFRCPEIGVVGAGDTEEAAKKDFEKNAHLCGYNIKIN